MRRTYLQDTKAIFSRPWVLLIILVVISLALCGIYANEKEDGALHRVQNSCATIMLPLSFVGNSLNEGMTTVYDHIRNVTSDPKTIKGLEEENSKLKSQLIQLENYKQEAERLEKLLNIKNQYNLEGVCARVLGKSSSAWNQTVTVGCGTNDGISAGKTVIGSSGVVGQVESAGPATCVVRLLSDPNSGVAVKIQSSQNDCILRGSLDGVLSIDDLDTNAQIQVGDAVVTSGLGGSYVSGLVIGSVSQIIQNQSGSGRKVIVAPIDKSGSLNEVLVVKGEQ